jgi:N-acylneuraminate cytidylyltransferase
MRLCVIPARGGSKRIPRKNIRSFAGKPIIAYSIEIALKSGLFDSVIVSTDDHEIANISQQWGAEVPFLRPPELANDYAGTTEVIGHSISWAQAQGRPISAVCCIYATAPFLQVADLVRGLRALESGEWAYTFSVTDYAASIFRSFRLLPGGGIEMFYPEHFFTRSQDLPLACHDAAQFYWGLPSSWLESKPLFDRHSYPVMIPRWRVQDIDTEQDWKRAELMFAALANEGFDQ